MAHADSQQQPHIKHARSSATWLGGMKTRLTVRDFEFYTAEPEKMGGDNSAPTPMEYVVASLNGCLAVTIELVAAELGIEIRELRMKSEGSVDRRGLFGTADVSPHFQRVVNSAAITTTASNSDIERLKAIVAKRCPVYNLIRDAGAVVDLEWAVEGPSANHGSADERKAEKQGGA